MHEIVLVGEAVAGEASKKRALLESLIANIDKQTLDVAELLHEVQSKGLYAPDFNTYKEYTRSLKLKDRKAEYLPKIIKVMGQVGFGRDKYEHLGIGRLREITSLIGEGPHAFSSVDALWTNPETGEQTPIKDFIIGFIEQGEAIEMEDLKKHIKVLKGLTGENDLTWLNLCFQTKVMEDTVRPAIEKIKAHAGSVGKDDDGVSKDITDSKAVEYMCIEINNDPLLGGEQ